MGGGRGRPADVPDRLRRSDAARDGVPRRRQHRDVFHDRQLQGGPGAHPGSAGAAWPMTGWNFNLAFAPQLPLWLIIALALASGLLVAWGLWSGVRGAWVRAIAWVFVVLALLNPAALFEDREPLKSVVVVITDASGSQKLDGRTEQSEAIRAQLMQRFGALDAFEVREVKVED